MNRLIIMSVLVALVTAVAGLAVGYEIRAPSTSPPIVNQFTQSVKLSSILIFTCYLPSSQSPYLQGTLGFALRSTYWTDIVASVAYTGDWTGDANQLVHPNSAKDVTMTWGPGKMQNIEVMQCPHVGLVIWLVQQDLTACPNPPCDAGLNPAP